MIIDLRASIREGKEVISNDDLLEWDDVIRDVYFEIFTHLMNPPEIRNTDGDELLFHNMIFKIDFLIEYISAYFTLEKGDIIITGTPSGIGEFKRGDIVEIEIENLGTLKNQMV